MIPYPGGPTDCIHLLLRLCQRPSPHKEWVGFPLRSANTTSRGGCFEAADISLCSGLQVCSPSRSFLPLRILPQGSQGFYVRAERASLPPHAPDMLTVRIQVIDGTRTFTSLNSQPCRLLTLPQPDAGRWRQDAFAVSHRGTSRRCQAADRGWPPVPRPDRRLLGLNLAKAEISAK